MTYSPEFTAMLSEAASPNYPHAHWSIQRRVAALVSLTHTDMMLAESDMIDMFILSGRAEMSDAESAEINASRTAQETLSANHHAWLAEQDAPKVKRLVYLSNGAQGGQVIQIRRGEILREYYPGRRRIDPMKLHHISKNFSFLAAGNFAADCTK